MLGSWEVIVWSSHFMQCHRPETILKFTVIRCIYTALITLLLQELIVGILGYLPTIPCVRVERVVFNLEATLTEFMTY